MYYFYLSPVLYLQSLSITLEFYIDKPTGFSYSNDMKNIRQDLIFTMFETLYTEGYHASNLNDVLKKAGTSKGGMYHHFDSKQSLAIACIEDILGAFIHQYWESPINESENGVQTLLDLINNLAHENINHHLDIDFQYGCPMNNLIQELSAHDELFTQALRNLFDRWESAIVQALSRSRKLLRIDIDINHAAAFIIASIEGSFTYAKIHQSKDAFMLSMNQLAFYIKSLLR